MSVLARFNGLHRLQFSGGIYSISAIADSPGAFSVHPYEGPGQVDRW